MRSERKVVVPERKSALIALGANEPSHAGTPEQTLRASIDAIAARGLQVVRVSRFFVTPAFPNGSGPDFVNACIEIVTSLTPTALLGELHDVERAFGRVRENRWGARTLDLDLLAMDAVIHPDRETVERWMDLPLEAQMARAPDGLILPHPRLSERAFVLIPLADIAPHWRHPITQETVAEMLLALPAADKHDVKPL